MKGSVETWDISWKIVLLHSIFFSSEVHFIDVINEKHFIVIFLFSHTKLVMSVFAL